MMKRWRQGMLFASDRLAMFVLAFAIVLLARLVLDQSGPAAGSPPPMRPEGVIVKFG